MKLLRNTTFSFLPRGMGTDILVKNALTVGILRPPKNIPRSLTEVTLHIASFIVSIYDV
jgi:hypothetical protein